LNIASKLYILDQIYSIYDDFSAQLDLACKKYCVHCCTTHVTLTTLEGYKVIDNLIADGEFDVIKKIELTSDPKRFQPKITTNQLAEICADGLEPLEEGGTEQSEPCSFLTEKACPLYKVRPFGCRCLVSRYNCGEKGYAEIDDFVLSVNTVILQTIEHMDINGCTGNLMDVLNVMSSEDNQTAYRNNALKCQNAGLISNHPLKVLMIPPEHRPRMEPILQALRKIKI